MVAAQANQIRTTLYLRSEPRENLLYIVEVEDDGDLHRYYESENYHQALLVAKRIFHKLKINTTEDFGVLIESQYGLGACYDINTFSFDASFSDSDDFYKDLCNDFEFRKLSSKQSKNVLFREMINERKLNEYQEQRFLQYLKRLGNV